MKKHLTLLALLSTGLLVAGCQAHENTTGGLYYDSYDQAAPVPSKQVTPTPRAKPVAKKADDQKLAPNYHFNPQYFEGHEDLRSDVLSLDKQIPKNIAVGQEYMTRTVVTARRPVTDATVTDTIPNNTKFVKSDPQATKSGNEVTWHLGTMNRGDVRTIEAWYLPTSAGTRMECTTFDAKPRTCHKIFVGQPELSVIKKAPEMVEVGKPFTYNIIVKNTGDTTATNVVLRDTLPPTVKNTSGNQDITVNVGDLAPQQSSKPLTINAIGNRSGSVCNTAVASSDSQASVNSTACTKFYRMALDLVKRGEKTEYIGKQADYSISLRNTGDITQQNVKVIDTAPQGTRVVNAGGGELNGNTVTWTVPSLLAGENKTFKVTLTSATAGTRCNQATVTSGQMNKSAQACTDWQGLPAVLVEMIDTKDPLLVGEQTTYKIRVTNQGSGTDHDVKVNISFPNNIKPISANGAGHGTVNGQLVSYAPVTNLGAKDTIEYNITAKAVAQGKNKIKAQVMTDSLKTPVNEEESTHVY